MSDAEDIEFNIPYVKIGFYAIALLLIGVLFLPFIQEMAYRLFAGTPGFTQWAMVSLLIAVAAVKTDSGPLLLFAGVVFVVMALIVGPVAGGVYAHTDMANQMQSDATELETLPNTSADNIRTLPRSVSDNYAQSSMQYPKFRLTGSDIAYQNGSYKWSHGLAPDNFMVSWFGKQKGAMYVNMTTIEKDVAVENTEFNNGRGQLFFDSYKYQSVLHDPFKLHNWGTTFNARADGTSYIAHSTTTYDWKFRFAPIPQFYAIPQHGSVQVMEPSGDINTLSPSEAQESKLLRGQNYYPYHIAMFKVQSMQYVNGALNKWFWKEGVLQIADLPEEGNQWPLTVPTEASGPELTYFIATEPTGSGNGVYEVWTVDGQTGKAGVQEYDDSQLGPQKAVDFVERRQEVNRLSNAEAVAPIPIVKGDSLYWHVKVVPESRSGVIYTAFVNAESGDTTLVDGTKQIYAFMRQSNLDEVRNRTDSTGDGTMVSVVVIDENGSIEGTQNITVPQNGSVQVNINSTTAKAN